MVIIDGACRTAQNGEYRALEFHVKLTWMKMPVSINLRKFYKKLIERESYSPSSDSC